MLYLSKGDRGTGMAQEMAGGRHEGLRRLRRGYEGLRIKVGEKRARKRVAAPSPARRMAAAGLRTAFMLPDLRGPGLHRTMPLFRVSDAFRGCLEGHPKVTRDFRRVTPNVKRTCFQGPLRVP